MIDDATDTMDDDVMDDDVMDDDVMDDDVMDDSIIRCKWVMDGATTLTEAAHRLQAYAAWLLAKERLGHQLTKPVEDDYGFVMPAFAEDK